MGLLALPNEILFLIAESLSYSWDVSVFSQLNRRLYALLNAYVYQHNIRHCDGHVLPWAAEHGSEITARKMLDEVSQSILSRYDLCSRSMSLSLNYGQEPVLRLFLERGITGLSQCNGQIYAAVTFAAIHGYDSGVRLLLDGNPTQYSHAA